MDSAAAAHPAADCVVLVPVKAFGAAKARLASVLSPAHREALARWSAERVVAAAGELPVYVACDSDDVAEWATSRGASVLWRPGTGLNAAVASSVAELAERGARHVVVAHGDLPRAERLARFAQRYDGIVLVPDAALDGTNVAVVPARVAFPFAYGAGSFRRHLHAAIATGCAVTVCRDPLLALDLDTPTDLTHPLVQEVLPEWLPTSLANQRPNQT